jgi:hypothetical protein
VGWLLEEGNWGREVGGFLKGVIAGRSSPCA